MIKYYLDVLYPQKKEIHSMEIFKQYNTQLIKAKIFNDAGIQFVKVTDSAEYEFPIGKVGPGVNFNKRGYWFTPIEYVNEDLKYGDGYRKVTVDDNEMVFVSGAFCHAFTITLSEEKTYLTF